VTVVNVALQGAQVALPSREAIVAHRAALHERLAEDATRRWGGMAVYIQEEGVTGRSSTIRGMCAALPASGAIQTIATTALGFGVWWPPVPSDLWASGVGGGDAPSSRE
jgi:hypothetical protein